MVLIVDSVYNYINKFLPLDCHEPKWFQGVVRFFSSCSSSSLRDELVSPLPSVPSVELVQGKFQKKEGGGVGWGGGGGGGVFPKGWFI